MTVRYANRSTETGGALVTVLFLVTILSFLVLSISQTTILAAERSFASRNHGEIYWRLVGVEALAKSALERAMEEQESLTLENPLLTTVYDLPLTEGTAQLAFSDQTRCINLNALSDPVDGSEENPRGASKEATAQELQAFGQLVGWNLADVSRLISVVTDWVDADDFQEADGAEDVFYTALPTPYRTGAGPLADVSEVRAMAGIGAAFFQQIFPIVCTHEASIATPVNVNLLTPDDAPFLAAVLGEVATIRDAQEIIAARPPGGYGNIADFLSGEVITDVRQRQSTNDDDNGSNSDVSGENDDQESSNEGGRFSVNSKYLQARAVVEQGGSVFELNLVFLVDGDRAMVVSRRIGRLI